ncbi:MAG: flagellar hook protein FlgE [Bosea sp.]|uniref:flagellar hook protein FlgE n=1 Tax=Bosea sp. (in: a-proteobacteria) TaxID=1871050 RepID=UPI002392ADB9|nr:flagellar hook protein FlgE [Bosea sp. (in: a-proteobacteria)]MCP4737774.1 flagellar hook protein FlgE [Bosea sp. (in: a-proteobacteria)]
MGIFGIMRTGVSGMAAQASKLSAASDNIANVNTVGYKRASTEFSSFISEGNKSEYNSGGVETKTRYAITDEGVIMGATNATDLAIKGNGFFVVSNAAGTPYMTRAGAFVPNGDKDLINSAGFYLMGYPLKNGTPDVIANSLDGLQRVNLANVAYQATPTTAGSLKGNMDFNAPVVAAANLPSTGAAGSQFESKSSIVTYDNVGNKVFLDVYLTKSANAAAGPPATPATWEVAIFNKDNASATGGFPYSPTTPLATSSLTFDGDGKLTTSPATMTVNIPNGQPLALDLSQVSQTAVNTSVDLDVNGNAPSAIERVEIASDGTVFAVFENSARLATYRIPLATVPSPDQLTPQSGNVYSVNQMSGDVLVGFPESGQFGSLRSKALEQSNVDLANELTAMIESQRSYTASSKVFQTGAELLDVLVNLKR